MKAKLWLLILCLAALPVAAQQQTGDLVVKVSDASNAMVPGASVTITSPSLINPIQGQTDSQGFYYARNLPSGNYKVTVTKNGFRSTVRDKVAVEVGRTFTIPVPLELGVQSQTVEVSAAPPIIDTLKSESAATYRGETLTNVPVQGRDFTSFAKLAPSVNAETFAGGLSVDGASGSENQFYVDGVNTSNIFNGLNDVGVRTELVQEMQVKSGGYEAEFGGAMGGVVSVVTKSGSNDLHGMLYYYYSGSGLTGRERRDVYKNPLYDPADPTSPAVLDVRHDKDHSLTNEFGVNLGGPIVKDKAWFFLNVNPTWTNISRKTFLDLDPTTKTTYNRDETRRAGLAKIDIQPVERLRLFLNYSQDTFRYVGALPSKRGTSSSGYPYGEEGYKYPSYTFGGGLTWTISPKILFDSRYGFMGADTIQFLQPTQPTRYTLNASSGAVGWQPGQIGYAGQDTFNQSAGAVYATTQDYNKKLSWTNTANLTFNLGGVHNFKAGYVWERWALDVASAHIYDYLRFFWGQTYSDLNGNTRTSSCVGVDGATHNPCGYLEVRSPFGEVAKLHTDHNAFFFQDAWTIGNRLTINPGIRFESEEIPSFSSIPQYAGAAVKWGFGDKIAPRIGASFDLFGNGKAKIYGSWGMFYDQMKLTMAEGSFGGFKWHSQYYLLNSAAAQNWYNMGMPHDATAFSQNCNGSLTGGQTTCDPYPTGVVGDAGLQFIEDRDWRLPSFDTLDPAIKPMRMQNMTVGTEWQLPSNLIFSFQFVHKQLDRTIEDVGVLTPLGEQYYITNPGFGYSVSKFQEVGLPPTPKAKRDYNAAEFRIRRPFSRNFMADVSYTYSRLRGNYGGLASSDEDTSNGIGQGRTDPNVERYFDEWYLSYEARTGKLAYGPLNTDRPHQIKASGIYQLPRNLPQLSVFYTLQSGTPITTIATVEHSEMIMNHRGDMGRLPWFSQTDLMVKQIFKPFKDEAKSLEFSVNVVNLFNQESVLHRYRNVMQQSLDYGYTAAGAGPGANWASGSDLNSVNQFLQGGWLGNGDWMASVNAFNAANGGRAVDPRYGLNDLWQDPLSVRLGFRFNF